jgi:hypothetical protein
MDIKVMQWRKTERERLVGERLAIPSDIRKRHAEQIVALKNSSAMPTG